MADRLFVAVIGGRNAGKSTTWNCLFGRDVRTGKEPRLLDLKNGLSTKVFLISGSNEERHQYAADVLEDVNCRIILCSVQYTEGSFESTWNHVFEEGFSIYAQWLNPGFDGREWFDRWGLMNILLYRHAVVSIRDGRVDLTDPLNRVEEIRQYIHGWAAARDLTQ